MMKLKVSQNENPKLKLSYKERKVFSVDITKKYLANDSKWLPMFLSCKKKDDLGDAFLYNVNYLEYKGFKFASDALTACD